MQIFVRSERWTPPTHFSPSNPIITINRDRNRKQNANVLWFLIVLLYEADTLLLLTFTQKLFFSADICLVTSISSISDIKMWYDNLTTHDLVSSLTSVRRSLFLVCRFSSSAFYKPIFPEQYAIPIIPSSILFVNYSSPYQLGGHLTCKCQMAGSQLQACAGAAWRDRRREKFVAVSLFLSLVLRIEWISRFGHDCT